VQGDFRPLPVLIAFNQDNINVRYPTDQRFDRDGPVFHNCRFTGRYQRRDVSAGPREPPTVFPFAVKLEPMRVMLDDGDPQPARLEFGDQAFDQRRLPLARKRRNRIYRYAAHIDDHLSV